MGLNDYRPEFRLLANAADITELIRNRLVSLSLTDTTGLDADTLDITLANDDPINPIRKPPRGAELRLELGYNGVLHKMGLFLVAEVGLSGIPDALIIRATGAPFVDSLGALRLQTQKSRTWKRGITLDDLVATIALAHGLTPFVSNSLSGIQLSAWHQTAESDVSFLTRLGAQYDAMIKIGGGVLAVLKRGEQKRADGSPMPIVVVNKSDVGRYNYDETSRDESGTVVAFWHSKRKAKREEVTAGYGSPVKQLRNWYPTEAAAKAAAESELAKRKRGRASFSCSMPGNPVLSAEATLSLQGFHPDIPTNWIITHVTHRLGADGYLCDVDACLPND